jgi:polyvinyl alcohol dehydrogenase (cytochrome)
VRWTFEADAGVRGAVLVGADVDGAAVAYFVDYRTSAYALRVDDGALLWKTRVGWHPEANNTGSPALADDKLIVPISSMEVVRGGDPTYECCTSSGAVAAVDVTSGDVIWYHRVIPDDAVEVGATASGTKILAPSGAPVWSSPTVDLERGVVYIGTGENYTRPTTSTSDAIQAVDLETGELVWSFQALAEDAFTMGCTTGGRGSCPSPPGPDLDFGMAPMLVTRTDGKDVLIAGQKSGVVWALEPDADGAVLWSTRVGKGGALGGIHWGMATDGRYAYAANADRGAVIVDVHPDKEPSPGLYALDLVTGDVAWSAPAPEGTCEVGRRGCMRANSAAPTAMPGVVFAGGLDGHVRAHATDDGRVLWDFDTARMFETVNGVTGQGGSIDGPGPVVAGGVLYVNSGYGTFSQMPGNVLLAFEIAGR